MAASTTGTSLLVQPENLRHLLTPLEVTTKSESFPAPSSFNTFHWFGGCSTMCSKWVPRLRDLHPPARTGLPGTAISCSGVTMPVLLNVLHLTCHSSALDILFPSIPHSCLSIAINSSKLVPDWFCVFDLISEITTSSQN